MPPTELEPCKQLLVLPEQNMQRTGITSSHASNTARPAVWTRVRSLPPMRSRDPRKGDTTKGVLTLDARTKTGDLGDPTPSPHTGTWRNCPQPHTKRPTASPPAQAQREVTKCSLSPTHKQHRPKRVVSSRSWCSTHPNTTAMHGGKGTFLVRPDLPCQGQMDSRGVHKRCALHGATAAAQIPVQAACFAPLGCQRYKAHSISGAVRQHMRAQTTKPSQCTGTHKGGPAGTAPPPPLIPTADCTTLASRKPNALCQTPTPPQHGGCSNARCVGRC